MEADIEQNTREEFKRFLVTLLQCEREEGIDAIDDDQAAEDAQELYDVRHKSHCHCQAYYSFLNSRQGKLVGGSLMNPCSQESWRIVRGCRFAVSQLLMKIFLA